MYIKTVLSADLENIFKNSFYVNDIYAIWNRTIRIWFTEFKIHILNKHETKTERSDTNFECGFFNYLKQGHNILATFCTIYCVSLISELKKKINKTRKTIVMKKRKRGTNTIDTYCLWYETVVDRLCWKQRQRITS